MKDKENETKDIKQNDAEPETNPAPAEKLFTQSEVDKIISQRIAREKAKEPQPAPAIDEAALNARSNMLDCKEYVINNGLSMDLLDILDTSDVQGFKEKAEKLKTIINKTVLYPEVEDRGEVLQLDHDDDALIAAFKNSAHKPKQFK